MSKRTLEIKVENGVPVPPIIRRGRPPVYPWLEMKVGDSFFVPGGSTKKFSAVAVARKRTGFDFTIRQVEGGMRVWRTA